jgi:vanillate O-demethylase ferredoxin subunit
MSTELLHVTIADRRIEADGIVSLELKPASGDRLPAFAAGSHIDVHLGPELMRQYSLCNDPVETHRYLIGVLLEPASRGGSKAIHDLQIGQTVTISAPRNNFPLDETAGKSVLVAGGIGVTPMIAMAHRLHALGADFEFHYCARAMARAAFLDRLGASPFADKVSVHFDDGAPEQAFSLDKHLKPEPGRHLYVCGPGGFMDYVVGGAKRLGWQPGQIHLEYFSATIDDSANQSFTIRTTQSKLELVVPADKSIARVLKDHGVHVQLACEEGVCGTCLTPVLEGVPDHRDLFQTDEEKAENNYMTVCCSRAKTPVLVLDI